MARVIKYTAADFRADLPSKPFGLEWREVRGFKLGARFEARLDVRFWLVLFWEETLLWSASLAEPPEGLGPEAFTREIVVSGRVQCATPEEALEALEGATDSRASTLRGMAARLAEVCGG